MVKSGLLLVVIKDGKVSKNQALPGYCRNARSISSGGVGAGLRKPCCVIGTATFQGFAQSWRPLFGKFHDVLPAFGRSV